MALVLYSQSAGVATLTLNRDDKRNAVNRQMADELLAGLSRAVEEEARVVVLRANAGVSVWCAGHDLSELDPESLDEDNATLAVCRRILDLPLPVVAMVEGSVRAGGLILLLAADIVVAAENADVSIPAGKIGLPLAPQWYALWLRVMGLHKVKEMLLAATTLSAAEAHASGLYNRLVPHDALEPTVYGLAAEIAAGVPAAVAHMKRHLNALATTPALSEEDLAAIEQGNQRLLNDPATRERIAAILASLQR